MYRRLVERSIRHAYSHLSSGDAEPVIRRLAQDVRLIFRGDSALGADLLGKGPVTVWFRELMQLGLQWKIHDVLVAGPPWNTRVVTCYTARLAPGHAGAGGCYRGVQYARLRWGRLQAEEILPDTHAVAALFRAPPRRPPGLEPLR